MAARSVDEATIHQVMECGEITRKDDAHLWVHMRVEGRSDNLVCVAAVEAEAIIIKIAEITILEAKAKGYWPLENPEALFPSAA